jgi:protein MAK16
LEHNQPKTLFFQSEVRVTRSETQTFCRNEYNLTGLCSKPACPLANGNYATVKEIKGKLFLFIKKIERQFTPNRIWEKVKLSDNYSEALKQIDEELLYWNKFVIHKSKQRLTKLTEMLRRKRKLKLRNLTRLVAIKKKTERRDDIRMAKAEIKAKVEKQIEEELLERLKKGTYGEMYEDLLNLNPKAFDGMIEEKELEEEDEYAEDLEALELNVCLMD